MKPPRLSLEQINALVKEGRTVERTFIWCRTLVVKVKLSQVASRYLAWDKAADRFEEVDARHFERVAFDPSLLGCSATRMLEALSVSVAD